MRTKLFSLIRRACSLIKLLWLLLRQCHDIYSPEDWVLLYYPHFYFGNFIRNCLVVGVEKEHQSLHDEANWSSLSRITALRFLILVLMSYTLFIFYYHFLDARFLGKRLESPDIKDLNNVEEDNPYGFANPVSAKILETNPSAGLTDEEVVARREIYGYNEIWAKRSWALLFQRLCLSPTNLFLEFTILLALVAYDWRCVLFSCCLLAYNIRFSVRIVRQYDGIAKSFGFNPIIQALVLRNGRIVEISLRDLVPGDIVHVSEGSVVPADCRVRAYDGELAIDQSSITGDNKAVEKFHGDSCYAMTGVLRGDAFLTVMATGHQTFLGRILSLLSNPSPDSTNSPGFSTSPPQDREFHWVIHCLGAVLCTVAVSCFFIIYRVLSRPSSSKLSFELYLALTLIIVPASLTTNIGNIRVHGAAHLSKEGIVVQAIPKSEYLAGIDILCCDKTGTVTENRLSLGEPYSIYEDPEDVILASCLTISPDTKNLDPIEKAFARVLKYYPRAKDGVARYKVVDHEPFNPETKRMLSLVEAPSGERILITKGAPRSVLETCLQDNPDTQQFVAEFKAMATKYAQQGFRSLGVARKRQNHKWELLGLVPLFDPIRFNSARAIRKAKSLGISVRMFTGDAVAIAKQSAFHLGLRENCLVVGSDTENLPSEEISTLVEEADVYAEVFPSDKYKIVSAFQSQGHLVAVTGDGVSDAPTLRKADCGLAVEGSTETAQASSDIVFMNPGIEGIVQAIEKSRQIFQLTYTYLVYRISVSLYLVMFLLSYFKVYHETLDLNLLIINTHFTDLIAIALCYSHESTPYSKLPARWSLKKILSSVAILSSILLFGTWSMINKSPKFALTDLAEASTIRARFCFLQIVLLSHWLVILVQTNGRPWVHGPSWRLIITVLSIDTGVTILCILGCFRNDYGMNLTDVCRVWLNSFGTLCLAAASLAILVEPSSPLV